MAFQSLQLGLRIHYLADKELAVTLPSLTPASSQAVKCQLLVWLLFIRGGEEVSNPLHHSIFLRHFVALSCCDEQPGTTADRRSRESMLSYEIIGNVIESKEYQHAKLFSLTAYKKMCVCM